MRNPARWGIPLLLLTLAPLPSCRVAQPKEVTTAGMRIDVTSGRQKRGVVEGRECSLRPGRRDEPITIGPRANEDLRWIFETGENLPRGTYSVEIRDFKIDGLPSGDTAVFTVNL
jgi:hypothetical protein